MPGYVTSSEDASPGPSRGLSSVPPGSVSSYRSMSSDGDIELLIMELPSIPLEESDDATDRESEPASGGDSESDFDYQYRGDPYPYVDVSPQQEDLENVANEYILAFEGAMNASRSIERFSTRVEEYVRRLGVWFEYSETFRCLEAVENELANASAYFEGLLSPEDIEWSNEFLRFLTDELHGRIYRAYEQIRIGEHLLRRGWSVEDRLRGLQLYLNVDVQTHSHRLLRLVQRFMGV